MPKQFISIIEGGSLLEQTLRRIEALEHKRPICVANEAHRFLVSSALDAVGMDAEILLEPFSRNTAPALAAVAALLVERDPKAVLLSLPADHYIPDAAAFASTVTQGLAAAEVGWIVTGIGRVTCGDREFLLRANESALVSAGALHSIQNPGRLPLVIVETLSGSYFGEDDVIRSTHARNEA